jgi:hypothetical protein
MANITKSFEDKLAQKEKEFEELQVGTQSIDPCSVFG